MGDVQSGYVYLYMYTICNDATCEIISFDSVFLLPVFREKMHEMFRQKLFVCLLNGIQGTCSVWLVYELSVGGKYLYFSHPY